MTSFVELGLGLGVIGLGMVWYGMVYVNLSNAIVANVSIALGLGLASQRVHTASYG